MPLEEQELPKYLIMSSPQLVGFTNCPIICLCCDVRYDFRVKNKIKKKNKKIKKKKNQTKTTLNLRLLKEANELLSNSLQCKLRYVLVGATRF
jgi:hypothetical protein